MTYIYQERCDGQHRGTCPFVVTHLGSYAADRRDEEEMAAFVWAFPSVAARDQAAEQLGAHFTAQGPGWSYTWSVWRSIDSSSPIVSILYSQAQGADISPRDIIEPVLIHRCGRQWQTENETMTSAHAGHLISVEEGFATTCPETFRLPK